MTEMKNDIVETLPPHAGEKGPEAIRNAAVEEGESPEAAKDETAFEAAGGQAEAAAGEEEAAGGQAEAAAGEEKAMGAESAEEAAAGDEDEKAIQLYPASTPEPDLLAMRSLDLLQTRLDLPEKPTFQLEMIPSKEYGPSFVPVGLKMPTLSKDQFRRARLLLLPLLRPFEEADLEECYLRLRLNCAGAQLAPDDERVRRRFYRELFGNYPACVALKAAQYPFRWFPPLGELKAVCEEEDRYFKPLRDFFFK